MADHVGQQLGNYRLIRLLGRGGFADVYLGEHRYLKTQAAIKVLQTRLAGPKLEEQFRNEAETIAHLKHPNIIHVLDFDIEDGTPFLVMDYAAQGTLRQRHPESSILPEMTILSYVKQVASALQYAHNQRLIHRDVKPENLLLGENQQVLLSDFGIAAIAHSTRSLSTQEEASGTFPYTAPEQIQGKPRPASDQYSLGIVVYEWLSGTRPFHGDFIQLMYQHVNVPPRPLHESVSTISPAVEQVVLQALAKDPQERFPSVQAFADALEKAIITRRPPLPLPPPPPSDISPKLQQTLRGHSSVILRLTWSRDGRILASTGNDKTIMLWNADTGEEIRTLTGHSSGVNQVAWSLKGDILVSCCNDHSMSIWETATGKLLRHMEDAHFDDVPSVAWSPDGQILASGSSDTVIKLWHINPNRDFQFLRMLEGHKGGVRYVVWSPEGKKLASCSADTTIRIWDPISGTLIRTLRGHTDTIICIAWSPDNRILASASYDGSVRIWDTETGQQKQVFTGPQIYVRSVSFSCDGRLLASNSPETPHQQGKPSEGKVRIRRTDTWEQAAVLPELVAWWWVPGLAFHPTIPDILATLGEYDRVIHIWRLERL